MCCLKSFSPLKQSKAVDLAHRDNNRVPGAVAGGPEALQPAAVLRGLERLLHGVGVAVIRGVRGITRQSHQLS